MTYEAPSLSHLLWVMVTTCSERTVLSKITCDPAAPELLPFSRVIEFTEDRIVLYQVRFESGLTLFIAATFSLS